MRIDEFASAEEQLALWKLVSDNVWGAIATQAAQQRRAQAEKAARSKPRRGKRASSPRSIKTAAPKVSIPAKPVADANIHSQQQTAATQQPVRAAPEPPSGPLSPTSLQPLAPIQPTPPITSSTAAPQVQQPWPKHPKPRITARAGGMTV